MTEAPREHFLLPIDFKYSAGSHFHYLIWSETVSGVFFVTQNKQHHGGVGGFCLVGGKIRLDSDPRGPDLGAPDRLMLILLTL